MDKLDSAESSANFLLGKPLAERKALLKKWHFMIGKKFTAKVRRKLRALNKGVSNE